MSNHTPTIDMLRHAYLQWWSDNPPAQQTAANEFDCCLTEHDRLPAERAWDEGHGHCFHVENPHNPVKGNPYRGEQANG